jgi:hypothetical protein
MIYKGNLKQNHYLAPINVSLCISSEISISSNSIMKDWKKEEKKNSRMLNVTFK